MKYVVYMAVDDQWTVQRTFDWFKRGAFNFALDLAEANPGNAVHVVGERPNRNETVFMRINHSGISR